MFYIGLFLTIIILLIIWRIITMFDPNAFLFSIIEKFLAKVDADTFWETYGERLIEMAMNKILPS